MGVLETDTRTLPGMCHPTITIQNQHTTNHPLTYSNLIIQQSVSYSIGFCGNSLVMHIAVSS